MEEASNNKEVVMPKSIPLTVLSGMLATLSPAEAKIKHCEDTNGQLIFTDTSCESMKNKNANKSIDPDFLFPNTGEKAIETNRIIFYCHSGTKKFTRC